MVWGAQLFQLVHEMLVSGMLGVVAGVPPIDIHLPRVDASCDQQGKHLPACSFVRCPVQGVTVFPVENVDVRPSIKQGLDRIRRRMSRHRPMEQRGPCFRIESLRIQPMACQQGDHSGLVVGDSPLQQAFPLEEDMRVGAFPDRRLHCPGISLVERFSKLGVQVSGCRSRGTDGLFLRDVGRPWLRVAHDKQGDGKAP